MAKQAGAVVVETDRRKLDQLSATGAHQGVIAVVAAHDYSSVDDIFARAAGKAASDPAQERNRSVGCGDGACASASEGLGQMGQ